MWTSTACFTYCHRFYLFEETTLYEYSSTWNNILFLKMSSFLHIRHTSVLCSYPTQLLCRQLCVLFFLGFCCHLLLRITLWIFIGWKWHSMLFKNLFFLCFNFCSSWVVPIFNFFRRPLYIRTLEVWKLSHLLYLYWSFSFISMF